MFSSRYVKPRQLGAAIAEEMEGRSVSWIVGTSLAFEAVLLAFGAWWFHRRDF